MASNAEDDSLSNVDEEVKDRIKHNIYTLRELGRMIHALERFERNDRNGDHKDRKQCADGVQHSRAGEREIVT